MTAPTLSVAELESLERLAKAATPGPWHESLRSGENQVALAPIWLILTTALFYWAIRLVPGTAAEDSFLLAMLLGAGATALAGFTVYAELEARK